MRRNLLIFSLLTCAASAQAQGTIQFTATLTGANETTPNNSPYVGSGWFTLDGSVLNYAVGMQGNLFLPTSAGIYGPATTGQSGPLIFDLGGYLLSFNPPTLTYGGGLFLTCQQIDDLQAGLWYVNFTSSDYPGGEIRGQITPVPEPATITLAGLVSLVAFLSWRRSFRWK